MDHKNYEWGHVEDLYDDFGVSVRRVYVDRGKVYVVWTPNGFSSAVVVTSGYGIVRFSNASMEIQPGRIIDAETYNGRTYLLEATAASGLSFVETVARVSV